VVSNKLKSLHDGSVSKSTVGIYVKRLQANDQWVMYKIWPVLNSCIM